ncbi:Uncharacterised protein [Mycobacteroides abscessus subsp. massiliense]|nr:Uncharacterised protein [Mycobacteroides abscessus subsp. massiliense]
MGTVGGATGPVWMLGFPPGVRVPAAPPNGASGLVAPPSAGKPGRLITWSRSPSDSCSGFTPVPAPGVCVEVLGFFFQMMMVRPPIFTVTPGTLGSSADDSCSGCVVPAVGVSAVAPGAVDVCGEVAVSVLGVVAVSVLGASAPATEPSAPFNEGRSSV